MIRSLTVKGLNKRISTTLTFHDDLNVITGTNGSGKTTVLKLIWLMISGNFEWIPQELYFDAVELITDEWRITGELGHEAESRARRYVWQVQDRTPGAGVESYDGSDEQIRKLNVRIFSSKGSSIFLPTFRRIEGGFAFRGAYRRYLTHDGTFITNELESSVVQLADRLSTRGHRFVASISTNDIVNNLTKQYADISERINEDHRALSRELNETIRAYEPNAAASADEATKRATDILESIRQQVTTHSAKQDDLLRPFTALNALIGKIFQHKGISVTSRLTLGDAANAISSDALSAGEKQMLSFLAYNAFEKGSVVFIDEPEISLHVDWQRTLFPILLEQGTKNQFIIATHSPFIYSKYADKELLLDPQRDRGGA